MTGQHKEKADKCHQGPELAHRSPGAAQAGKWEEEWGQNFMKAAVLAQVHHTLPWAATGNFRALSRSQ